MHEHKTKKYNLRCAVITVSTSRNEKNDETGKIIKNTLKKNGHIISSYKVVKDSIEDIQNAIKQDADVIIISGGTGISKHDPSYEAIKPLLTKELYGFGELFRYISYEEIGSRSMMSRAFAGIINDKMIFVLPGSPSATKLGLNKLIIPELNHIQYELKKEK